MNRNESFFVLFALVAGRQAVAWFGRGLEFSWGDDGVKGVGTVRRLSWSRLVLGRRGILLLSGFIAAAGCSRLIEDWGNGAGVDALSWLGLATYGQNASNHGRMVAGGVGHPLSTWRGKLREGRQMVDG